MPTIRVTAVEGHTEEQIRAFMDGVTRLAVDVLHAQEEGVIVHVELLPPHLYMRGGKTIADRRAAKPAAPELAVPAAAPEAPAAGATEDPENAASAERLDAFARLSQLDRCFIPGCGWTTKQGGGLRDHLKWTHIRREPKSRFHRCPWPSCGLRSERKMRLFYHLVEAHAGLRA